jgi:hypothetical protein
MIRGWTGGRFSGQFRTAALLPLAGIVEDYSYEKRRESGKGVSQPEAVMLHAEFKAEEQAQFLETRKFQIDEIARISRLRKAGICI